MRVIDPGHSYMLDNLEYKGSTRLDFFRDPEIHGVGQDGPTTQEVLRACIDRVKYLNAEKHWHGNTKIIEHLRSALVLFEARHMERLVEKNYGVENIPVNYKGHFV